jgi:hypothetical protein
MSLTGILSIITIAMTALEATPVIGAVDKTALALIQILQTALAEYHTATGQSLNLANIPLETPVAAATKA